MSFNQPTKFLRSSTTEYYPELIRVAGVVAEVRVITTKKTGAEMAFAKIDDGTGTLELVVFPKIFKLTRDFWTEGQPLLVFGKVDSRDETPALIVESIETLASIGS